MQQQPAHHPLQELASRGSPVHLGAAGRSSPIPLQRGPGLSPDSHQRRPPEGSLGHQQDCEDLLHDGVHHDSWSIGYHKTKVSWAHFKIIKCPCGNQTEQNGLITIFSCHREGNAIFSFKRQRLTATAFTSDSPAAGPATQAEHQLWHR